MEILEYGTIASRTVFEALETGINHPKAREMHIQKTNPLEGMEEL